jgi:hypothetical protein
MEAALSLMVPKESVPLLRLRLSLSKGNGPRFRRAVSWEGLIGRISEQAS